MSAPTVALWCPVCTAPMERDTTRPTNIRAFQCSADARHWRLEERVACDAYRYCAECGERLTHQK